MRRVARHTLAGLLATGLAVGLPIAVAAWAPADVTKTPPPPPPGLVVDDDGLASVSDCNAGVATFSTIQAAVNAASAGATIKVCPGVYGPAVVNKPLTIQGAQVGVDARTRAVPLSSESVVTAAAPDVAAFILAADNVTIDGFSLLNSNGPGVTMNNDHSGYKVQYNIMSGNSMGVYANSNGASQSTLWENFIHDNNNSAGCPAPGCGAAGNGVYEDQGTRNLLIQNNRIDNEQNTGVLLFIVPGAPPKLGAYGVTISSNSMQNDTTFIAVWDATNTTISSNSLSNGVANPALNSGIFIGAPSANTQLLNNILTNANFNGIAIRDADAYGNLQPGATTGVVVQGNRITGSGNNGLDVSAQAPNAARSTGNTSTNNALDGILYGAATNANTISGNTATGNNTAVAGAFDCQDLSHGSGTAGTANSWSSNTGNTSSPPGLCFHPAVK